MESEMEYFCSWASGSSRYAAARKASTVWRIARIECCSSIKFCHFFTVGIVRLELGSSSFAAFFFFFLAGSSSSSPSFLSSSSLVSAFVFGLAAPCAGQSRRRARSGGCRRAARLGEGWTHRWLQGKTRNARVAATLLLVNAPSPLSPTASTVPSPTLLQTTSRRLSCRPPSSPQFPLRRLPVSSKAPSRCPPSTRPSSMHILLSLSLRPLPTHLRKRLSSLVLLPVNSLCLFRRHLSSFRQPYPLDKTTSRSFSPSRKPSKTINMKCIVPFHNLLLSLVSTWVPRPLPLPYLTSLLILNRFPQTMLLPVPLRFPLGPPRLLQRFPLCLRLLLQTFRLVFLPRPTSIQGILLSTHPSPSLQSQTYVILLFSAKSLLIL